MFTLKKVLFTATVDSHILAFHIPYLEWFKKQGYEVHVATNGDEEIPFCDVKHKVSFERSPFKINNLKAIEQMKKICMKEKFEIIHTHTPMGATVTRLAAKKAKKKYNTKVIYTAHGFHFYKGAPILNWLLFYPVELYLSKFTDVLITINNEDYRIAKKRFKKTKVEFVHGVGLHPTKYNIILTKKEINDKRKTLGLKENDFVIIYVAELTKGKNQEWLIKNMKQLIENNPTIHLLLPGRDSLNGKCQNLIKELSLEKNIHLLGFRKDIPELLRISNVLISVSKREGLAVNVMEGIYMNLPVLITDCRGNEDLKEKNEEVFVIRQEDEKQFIDKFNAIYQKYNNILSNKNNKKFYNIYGIDNVLKEVTNIYKYYLNKRKKVIHILSSNKYSGAENVVCQIIESCNDDYDMVYCSPDGEIKNTLKEKNITFLPLKKLNLRYLKKVIKLCNPDIIHAHDFKASIYSSFFQKKIISEIHQNPSWCKNWNIKTILYLIASKNFKKIVTVSTSIINDAKFGKYIEKKTTIIDNVIDESKVKKMSNEKYAKNFDLCYFGRLSNEKNPILFIEIIKEYKLKYNKNIKACMIGTGSLYKECRDLINKYKLSKNITMLGFQANPFKIVNNCEVVIMPSKEEGFGLVAIESMSLGKPVLNSGAGGLEEIFKNNRNLICKTKKEYICKIKEILTNKKRYSYEIKRYTDLNKWIDKIEKIYL